MTAIAEVALVDFLGRRPEWWHRARCRGMGTTLFFPTRGETDRHARAICAACPVKDQCAADAMATPPINGVALSGVWGGTSQREREHAHGRRLRQ